MDPGLARDALTTGVGVLTGMLSGAFGVGGAVISTPGIRLLGASALAAVASTLPSIIPGAVSGGTHYAGQDLVEPRAVALTAPAGMVAAVVGSLAASALPGDGHPLMILTAIIMVFAAWRTARPSPALANREASGPRPGDGWRFAATGTAAGLLAGLLGVGGGIIMVPAFNQWCHLPLKRAIGTSLVCVGILAVPATITHAVEGNIDWSFALWLAVGAVPGALIGARLSIRATDQRLRATVGTFLAVFGVGYLVAEVVALTR